MILIAFDVAGNLVRARDAVQGANYFLRDGTIVRVRKPQKRVPHFFRYNPTLSWEGYHVKWEEFWPGILKQPYTPNDNAIDHIDIDTPPTKEPGGKSIIPPALLLPKAPSPRQCRSISTLHKKLRLYRLLADHQIETWLEASCHIVYMHWLPWHLAEYAGGPLIIEAKPIRFYDKSTDPTASRSAIYFSRDWYHCGTPRGEQFFALSFRNEALFADLVKELFTKRTLPNGTIDWAPAARSALIAADWVQHQYDDHTTYTALCTSQRQVFAISDGDERWNQQSK